MHVKFENHCTELYICSVQFADSTFYLTMKRLKVVVVLNCLVKCFLDKDG